MRTQHTRGADASNEAGVSLIELLVSMAIMAIILTALAGTLVVTLTNVNMTEQEVTATQLAGELAEGLQAGGFDTVALYENEIDPVQNPLATDWAARLGPGSTFETAALITVSGPVGTRDDEYPRPVVLATRGGLDFRLDRYLTWIDRDGDGNVETKRLTSFVTWTDRTGSAHELRFDSERVPTQAEAVATDTGTRVIQFSFSPEPVELNATSGALATPVNIFVRTNEGTSFGTFQLYEYDAVNGVFVLRTINATGQTLGAAGNYVTWTATLPTSTVLANGDVDVRFSAQDTASAEVAAVGTLDTYGGPHNFNTPTPDGAGGAAPAPTAAPTASPSPTPTGTAAPLSDVDITITASPAFLCVAASGQKRLAQDVTISVSVAGLSQSDGTVHLGYPYYSSKQALSGPPDEVGNNPLSFVSQAGSSASYSVTILAQSVVFKDGDNVLFTLSASRNGAATSDDVDQATFTASVNTSC